MKRKFIKISALLIAVVISSIPALAQNSLPAPGTGGSFSGGGNSFPAPGSGGTFNPAPPMGGPGPAWGSPGWNSWNGPMCSGIPLSTPTWQDSGYETVLAVGYDVQGIWRTIPLRIQYSYNGVNYDVTVDSAYDPWSCMWNYNIDMPAYSTYYYLRGNYYNYYTNLSTGTFYFNL